MYLSISYCLLCVEVYVTIIWVTAGYAGQQFTCILWVEYAKIAVITPNRWDFYVDQRCFTMFYYTYKRR